jgi:hypothetical protein
MIRVIYEIKNSRSTAEREAMKNTVLNRIKLQVRIWLALADFRREVRRIRKEQLRRDAGIFDLDAYRMRGYK